jgi:hypothetical protein
LLEQAVMEPVWRGGGVFGASVLGDGVVEYRVVRARTVGAGLERADVTEVGVNGASV